MIAWMLYTVLVSACLLVAASAAEWILRLARRPVRVVWILAGALALLFAATARLRVAPPPAGAAQSIDLSTLAMVQSGLRTVQRAVPPSIDRYMVALWCVSALAVLLAFGVAYLRVRRASQACPSAELHGHRVCVSSAIGPMVVGMLRPRIVIPEWIVDRGPAEQRLILEHEASHVAAHDPLVLSAACALVALMPWNAVLWAMLSRLRLAIELDCDARVLRGGGSPRVYGTLLVDVAERSRPLRFASLALSDSASQLQKRIIAMDTRRITHPLVRTACVALVGAAGLLAACEAKIPTSADIARMDASSAERTVKGAGLAKMDSGEAWMVDGKHVSASEAKAIPADSIATVNVTGFDGKHTVTMNIRTKGHEYVGDTVVYHPSLVLRDRRGSVGDPIAFRTESDTDQPILILNGKRTDASALKTLDRDKIAAVEVVKGPTAIATYGAGAKTGVIVVRTKP